MQLVGIQIYNSCIILSVQIWTSVLELGKVWTRVALYPARFGLVHPSNKQVLDCYTLRPSTVWTRVSYYKARFGQVYGAVEPAVELSASQLHAECPLYFISVWNLIPEMCSELPITRKLNYFFRPSPETARIRMIGLLSSLSWDCKSAIFDVRWLLTVYGPVVNLYI